MKGLLNNKPLEINRLSDKEHDVQKERPDYTALRKQARGLLGLVLSGLTTVGAVKAAELDATPSFERTDATHHTVTVGDTVREEAMKEIQQIFDRLDTEPGFLDVYSAGDLENIIGDDLIRRMNFGRINPLNTMDDNIGKEAFLRLTTGLLVDRLVGRQVSEEDRSIVLYPYLALDEAGLSAEINTTFGKSDIRGNITVTRGSGGNTVVVNGSVRF